LYIVKPEFDLKPEFGETQVWGFSKPETRVWNPYVCWPCILYRLSRPIESVIHSFAFSLLHSVCIAGGSLCEKKVHRVQLLHRRFHFEVLAHVLQSEWGHDGW